VIDLWKAIFGGDLPDKKIAPDVQNFGLFVYRERLIKPLHAFLAEMLKNGPVNVVDVHCDRQLPSLENFPAS
jgi:hypothetical protein